MEKDDSVGPFLLSPVRKSLDRPSGGGGTFSPVAQSRTNLSLSTVSPNPKFDILGGNQHSVKHQDGNRPDDTRLLENSTKVSSSIRQELEESKARIPEKTKQEVTFDCSQEDKLFLILALCDIYKFIDIDKDKDEYKSALDPFLKCFIEMSLEDVERNICESLKIVNRHISKTISDNINNTLWKANVQFNIGAPGGCFNCGQCGHIKNECIIRNEDIQKMFDVSYLVPFDVKYDSYLFREFGCHRFLKFYLRGMRANTFDKSHLPQRFFFGEKFKFGGRNFEFFCGEVPKSQSSSGDRVDIIAYFFATSSFVDGALSVSNSITIADLYAYMGNFEGTRPLKLNGRMLLGFSSTHAVKGIRPSQIEIIDDIIRDENVLTDGCGFVSSSLFPNIPENIRSGMPEKMLRDSNSLLPVCIQVRMVCHFGLMKGLLLVTSDDELCPTGKIIFRRSMQKSLGSRRFDRADLSEITFTLDVNRTFETPARTAKLNKDVCLLLSDTRKSISGDVLQTVPDEVFLDLLENELSRVQASLKHIERKFLYQLVNYNNLALPESELQNAREETSHYVEVSSIADEGEIDMCYSQTSTPIYDLEKNDILFIKDLNERIRMATSNTKDSLLYEFLNSGGDVTKDPYFRALVREKQRAELSQLALCRFRLPGAVYLVGMPDPYGVLPKGTVFIALQDSKSKTKYTGTILEGPVVVTRHPMHSVTNLRVLQAIDDRKLRQHMRNLQGGVIYFSTCSNRSDVDYMGGGDFDGDEYLIIYGSGNMRIIKSIMQSETDFIRNDSVLSKIESSKQQKKSSDDSKIYVELMKMSKDCLVGKLSNCWLAKADEFGPRFEECEMLNDFINIALDSCKSDVQLNLTASSTVGKILNSSWISPHYEVKAADAPCRLSTSIVGKIFNLVKHATDAINKDEADYDDHFSIDPDYGWNGFSIDEIECKDFRIEVEKHLEFWKQQLLSYKIECKSIMSLGVEQYNMLVTKYCEIFHEKAIALYLEKKEQQETFSLWNRKEELWKCARMVHACAVYTVTYSLSRIFDRKFTGLSFCWKICSQELLKMKFEVQLLKSGQSICDNYLRSERLANYGV